MGDLEKALALHQRVLEIDKKILGPTDPNLVINLKNLALVYAALGDFEKAQLFWFFSSRMVKKTTYKRKRVIKFLFKA